MTIESKSHKKTVYRAVRRADGVIVEKPRYQPSPSIVLHQANKHTPSSQLRDKNLPQDIAQDSRLEKRVPMSEDLRGVGGVESEVTKCVRDESNGVARRGRGGYNDVFRRRGDGHRAILGYHLRKSDVADPMQHFLEESGPWSTLHTRAAVFGDLAPF